MRVVIKTLRSMKFASMCYHSLLLLVVVIGCESSNTDLADDSICLPLDTLSVVLEIGEEIGDSTNTFSYLSNADIDTHGRIIAVDELDACVKVFDLQGNYIRQVSRRGSGPGELSHPRGIFIMPDGRLGVIAPSKQGFVIFDDSLNFVEEISLWLENSPSTATSISNSSLVAYMYSERTIANSVILYRTVAIYAWGEAEWETLLWKDSIEASPNDFFEDPSKFLIYSRLDPLCIDGNGEDGVYFAPKDPFEYRVTGWDSSGNEILSISRNMTPVEKTNEEVMEEIFFVTNYLQKGTSRSLPFEFEPNPYRNMIIGVGIGPENTLWVRRGTYTEPFFDVYDLDGNLLHHAVFPADGLSWETEITPQGILAWELDPLEGYQKLYLLE